jgi:hypothetical protein
LVAPGSAPPITSPSSAAMSIPRQLRFVISAFFPTSFKIGATVHDAELEVHFFLNLFKMSAFVRIFHKKGLKQTSRQYG